MSLHESLNSAAFPRKINWRVGGMTGHVDVHGCNTNATLATPRHREHILFVLFPISRVLHV